MKQEEVFSLSAVSAIVNDDGATLDSTNGKRKPIWAVTALEILLIVVTFLVACGEMPPDVNESHYLTKAKHFWNPQWCPADFFLSSKDAHHVFYFTFGWLTLFFSLPTVAWIGRCVAWIGLAWSWQRLSFRLIPKRFCSVLSAGIMIVLIEYFHLAGEWLVGGVEAKSFAYVAMFFGLERMAAGAWRAVWIAMAVAAFFHVLVGGWAFAASLVVFALSKPSRKETRKQLAFILLSFGLIVFAAVPAWALSMGAERESVSFANEIYVRTRLPHHLFFWSFEKSRITLYALAIICWFLVCGRRTWRPVKFSPGNRAAFRRLITFCNFAFLMALVGVVLGSFSEMDATSVGADLLLRYYWFRMSDVMMAVGLAIMLTAIVSAIGNRTDIPWLTWPMIFVCLTFFVVTRSVQYDSRPPADRAALTTYKNDQRRTQDTFRNWVRMCQWIGDNTSNDSMFLTPAEQQTFNWYANRSQVICFKDMPQDVNGICEWNRRVHLLLRGGGNYQFLEMHKLREVVAEFDVDYVVFNQSVVESRAMQGFPIDFDMVYPVDPNTRSTFVVMKANQ